MKVRTALISAALGLGAISLPTAALPVASAGASAIAAVSSPVETHGDLHVAPDVHIPGTHLPSPRLIGNGPDNSKLYDSYNWSGYAAVADKGVKLTAVQAEFTVPSVNCAKSSPGATGAYTAEWVGIDGFTSTSATVEQEGVEGYCATTSSTPVYSAWYEMYPSGPVAFTGDINPGDAIVIGTGKYKTGDNYQLTLTDVTTGAGFSTEQACPAGSTCGASSAEIIVEAPAEGSTILPLADYGVATFASSQVAVNYKAKANFSGSSTSYALAQINMVSDPGGASESTTSGFYGGSSFSANWISS